MTGALHYRHGGRIHVAAPEPYTERRVGGRHLWMHLVPIGTPAQVTTRDGSEILEWFSHASVRLPWPRPPFAVRPRADGGTVIGEVTQVWDSGAWIDAIGRVFEGEVGDAILDGIGGDGGRLPVSIGFRPVSGVTYPEGIMRTNVDLAEVAIVEQSAYGDDARTYARGFPPPPMSKRRV